MSSKNKMKLGLVIRLFVTTIILAYLWFKLDWIELGGKLIRTDPVYLALALLIAGVTVVLSGLRWWLLLKIQKIYLPFKTTQALTFIGQFFNLFLLGSTGGDFIKGVYVIKYAPLQKTHAALSIAVDRILGLFILLFLVLLAIPWQIKVISANSTIISVTYTMLVIFIGAIAFFAIIFLTPYERLPEVFHKIWENIPIRRSIILVVEGLRQHLRSPSLLFASISCSFAIWLLVFLSGYFIAQAIDLEVSYMQSLVIISIVVCAISLPISIGGHGVREGMFILMFALYGIVQMKKGVGSGQELAVLFSLFFFAIFSIWGLLGGAVYVVFKKNVMTDRSKEMKN